MIRWYRALLHLYPTSFRDEYGDEMSAVFAAMRQDATGPVGILALCCRTVAEILTNAAVVHWDILKQDLAYTLRTLRRSPGFTLTAVTVLALGIGATTAAFSVTDYTLFRPLPFPDSHQLVSVWEEHPGYPRTELSPANYRDLKAATTSFSALGAFRGLAAILNGGGEPEYIEGASVTADTFALLGAVPSLGRPFTAEDDRDGAPGTVILSYPLWQSRFGGDPAVLGRTVTLDVATYTIVGVMPRGFAFPTRTAALWTPMRFTALDFADRRHTFVRTIGRLRDDWPVAQARGEVGVIAAQLRAQYPAENAHTNLSLLRLRDVLSPQSRQSLFLLSGTALAVLLIACANVATLLMTRVVARRPELALRTALGAGRERVIRQIVTENTVLAFSGATLGVALGSVLLPLLVRLVPSVLPIAAQPVIDGRVLAFALATTAATVALFGLVPAVRGSGGNAADALGSGARVGSGRDERLRSALVAGEICVTLVLLVCSGLLLRALWTIQSVDTGFRPDGVLTMRTSLPMPKYAETDRRTPFYAAVLAETRALPGVSDAAYVSFLPLAFRGGVWPVSIDGRPAQLVDRQTASLRFVTSGFFSALGIPLTRGRDVEESDVAAHQAVAVVSESFVERHWPKGDALGRQFTVAGESRTVIGVVGDIRVRALLEPSEPQIYLPYQQMRDNAMTWYAPKELVIRASVPPDQLVPSIRAAVRKADPRQPISNIRTLADIVANETATRAVQLRVIAVFAGLAFLLAAAGIHGLLSYAVQQRMPEIGVRIALGAQPRDIIRLIAGRAAMLAASGVIAGLPLAYATGYAMRALLVGVTPGDPLTFSAAALVVAAMAIAGSLVPSRRALRIDPLKAIRAE